MGAVLSEGVSEVSGRLKVAAVGLGWVAQNRHLPVLSKSPLYEIVGLIDTNPGRAAKLAAQYRAKHYFHGGDLDAVPWLDEVAAVIVSTPPHKHYEVIRSALLHGKHVLTEKPLVMQMEEAEELIKMSNERGLTLGVVHNFQFARSCQELIRDLDSGLYGSIRGILVQQLSNPRRRLPAWYEKLPLGLFYDESPHMFYLTRRLAQGPLELVNCIMHPSSFGQNTPSAIAIQYRARLGQLRIPIFINMHFEAPISEWHVCVLAEEFAGDIDVFRDIYIRLPNDGAHTAKTVMRTSLAASWQHWWQTAKSGSQHLLGILRYGNDEVFDRFARCCLHGEELQDIGPSNAVEILGMQHDVLVRCTGAIKS